MIRWVATFLAELEKRRSVQLPELIERSHFMKAAHPLEQRLAAELAATPALELHFLILNFGLDGRDPQGPQQIAAALDMMFLKVLDLGTAAELRLRNRRATRELIEAIAGEEIEGLAAHLQSISVMRDEARRRSSIDRWFYSRPPLRRLAMSTALEGGFGALLRLVVQSEAIQLRQAHGQSSGPVTSGSAGIRDKRIVGRM